MCYLSGDKALITQVSMSGRGCGHLNRCLNWCLNSMSGYPLGSCNWHFTGRWVMGSLGSQLAVLLNSWWCPTVFNPTMEKPGVQAGILRTNAPWHWNDFGAEAESKWWRHEVWWYWECADSNKVINGEKLGPSGIQSSMSDLIVWSVDWMELLKFWHSSCTPVAITGEDVVWKFVLEWVWRWSCQPNCQAFAQ